MSSEPKLSQEHFPFVGKTYVFHYGGFAARNIFSAAGEISYEVIEGPAKGLKGKARYSAKEIRPQLFLITWQEDDGGTVVQLNDFSEGVSYSNYTDAKLQFNVMNGRITPEK